MAGTTVGGSFRYPYEFSELVDYVKASLGHHEMDRNFEAAIDNFVALMMDRDRALEDYTTAQGGANNIYDAIVDATATEDTSKRVFNGIGRAINYLAGLPAFLNGSMTIGVRKNADVNVNYTYEEDQNISASSCTVSIIGLSEGIARQSNQGRGVAVRWDLNNHSVNIPTLGLCNLTIDNTGATSYFPLVSTLWMRQTNLTAGGIAATNSVFTMECFIAGFVASPTFTFCTNTLFRPINSGTTLTSSPGSLGKWFFFNCPIGNATTWNLSPGATNVTFTYVNSGTGLDMTGGSFTTSVSFNFTGTCSVYIDNTYTGVGVTLTDPSVAYLNGVFSTVTRTNGTRNGPLSISGQIGAGTSSIAGPAHLAVAMAGSTQLVLTGSSISGHVQMRTTMGVPGYGVTLNSVTNSYLALSSLFAGSAAGQSSLLIDDSCSDVLIDLTGQDTWPSPYVNLGTNCMVRTTAGIPPSGAAGGDLGATYPNPTVQNLTGLRLFDAKGDLLVATGDNTPARLGVGNDQRELAADSTAAGGVSWRYTRALVNRLTQNQASLETSTTGWTASTGSSIAQTAAQASHGTKSLEITKS